LATAKTLTINLEAEDLGRIRFAAGPAPVLETVLMLSELRHRPRPPHGSSRGGGDWRQAARPAFAAAGLPLLQLAPSREHAFIPDVLTSGAEEAFYEVEVIPESARRRNVARIERMRGVAAIPDWLRRRAACDRAQQRDLDRALRSFYANCLASRWSQVTARFQRDVAERTALIRQHGVLAMLNTLSPDLHVRGTTLQAPSELDWRVRPAGHGLVLMPSAFWTGQPRLTWDPHDTSRYVLIYAARLAPSRAFEPGASSRPAADPLALLLGATRAAVLRALRQPHTTTTLARHVGISPASASDHATTLRAAGLVTSDRQGKAVIHRISELGSALLWHD
jgi:DNA-binding transcriptional ArsR family regulator